MSDSDFNPVLHVRLIVANAPEALAFYEQALGATVVERVADPNLGGAIVHAAFRVGDTVINLAQEHREYGNDSPEALGGSPVLLNLTVDDADAVGRRMEAAGAETVIPIDDRFYGRREGRLRDPFGHLWIISQELEKLSEEEIQRRMRAFNAGR